MRARLLGPALLLAACSGGHGRLAAATAPEAYGSYDRTGLASWYGDELKGNRTASGMRFDPDAITAAHRTLPLGSVIEVTAVETGRSILVLVNDRGPFHGDRLIDLSRGAAKLLGTGRRPVAAVRVRAVQPSAEQMATLRRGDAVAAREGNLAIVRVASDDLAVLRRGGPALDPARRYTLVVATFSNADRAQRLAAALDAAVVPRGSLYRVQLGPFRGKDAQRARDEVADRGYGDAVVLPAE